jgi:integrase
VYSAIDRKKLRRTFASHSAARAWQADAASAVRRGTLRVPTRITLREAATRWLNGAKDGSIRSRSGDPFKPSTIRSYSSALDLYVIRDLGGARLSEIRRIDLQDLADRLHARGLDGSTIRNALMPLRAIFRRAVHRGEIAVNPTVGLDLPAVRGRRDRIASAVEANALVDALPVGDRSVWAAAFYGGLRLGELRALRWEDVDLDAGVLRIERSWDPKAGPVAPKSRAGTRVVPVPSVLASELRAHQMRSGRRDGLVFGRTSDLPFNPSSLSTRAKKAWSAAGMAVITLHEARHTYASLMIAAGVNAKALSTYMGHSSITITLDRYGHLMPGNEEQAAELLDAYLERGEIS